MTYLPCIAAIILMIIIITILSLLSRPFRRTHSLCHSFLVFLDLFALQFQSFHPRGGNKNYQQIFPIHALFGPDSLCRPAAPKISPLAVCLSKWNEGKICTRIVVHCTNTKFDDSQLFTHMRITSRYIYISNVTLS